MRDRADGRETESVHSSGSEPGRPDQRPSSAATDPVVVGLGRLLAVLGITALLGLLFFVLISMIFPGP